VSNIHPSATIALKAHVVENLLRVLAGIDGGLVLVIEVCDNLAATPTSYWNKHI
jgi:hypothetical protein|tara:strand:- start:10473 stop:10634 length:162 start_codon:yes stop_codon:yes gene_type:complete